MRFILRLISSVDRNVTLSRCDLDSTSQARCGCQKHGKRFKPLVLPSTLPDKFHLNPVNNISI